MATEPRQELTDLNQQLQDRGWKVRVALVGIDEVDLLEKNSRFMRSETFRRLVANIENDGELESVPLCWHRDGRYLCLSGNHRVMAARQAGLQEILVMFRDDDLSDQERIAKQLSHNAIVGEDDPIILKELWEQIRSVDLKLYSGLDDKKIGEMLATAMKSLSEVRMDFRAVTFLFLPEEIERLEEVLKSALHEAPGRDVFLARFKDFDRTLDALANVQAAYNVRNTAVAMTVVLGVFEDHLTDLAEGWLEEYTGEPVHGGPVPISTVLGTDRIPTRTATLLRRSLDSVAEGGKVDKLAALERIAESTLTAHAAEA